MEMDDVTVLSIAQLIQRGLPLTGTSNLPQSSLCNPIPVDSLKSNPTNAESNRSPKVLTSLNHPAIIIGTLKLPTSALDTSNSKSSCRYSNNCFQFTDGSATVCCDILDIDIRMIGKEIRVFSWNFIPLRSGSGFLEIIKWGFLSPSSALPQCSIVDPVLLDSGNCSTFDDKLKAPYCVSGGLESVGPVTIVPCTVGHRNLQSNMHCNTSTDSKPLRGFMVQIMVCECKSCNSKESVTLLDDLVREHDSHSFVKSKIVYLCGSASSWHPVVTKFIGRFITFGGLKKKLVYSGKANSCLMYVSTEKSSLHISRSSRRQLPCKKNSIKGKGECNSYTGIIKGVYMQGMLLELDTEVWLLLTDQLLSPPHSLRVGAIVSVRNVHFVNPRFPWAKVLILGACVKTSIFVQLFSPLKTECHVFSLSNCMLRTLIETLPFSARLWILLVISSLRKMFAGVLSEKEILGSKHKEGLVQMYAKSHLPSSIYQYRRGALMKLYEHDSCGCGSEPCNISLKSVIPVSILVFYCTVTWIKTIRLENKRDITFEYNQLDHFGLLLCGGTSSCQTRRKVYQSQDIGFVLVGSLKISACSGRLQLVDATGGIDVLVPDLPSTWNVSGIYEVTKYSLVIEGIPQMEKYLANESFSCRSFFHSILLERDPNVAVYVYFNYRTATCRTLPLYSCIDQGCDFEIFNSGTYHLLQITHKFPVLQKLQGKKLVPNTSSVFVEAVIYSWDLFLTAKDKTHSTRPSMKQLMEDSKNANDQKHADKRPKFDHPSIRVEDADKVCDFGDSGSEFNVCSYCYEGSTVDHRCCNLSCHRISCLATVKNPKHGIQAMLGVLFNTSKSSCVDGPGSSAQRVLLEFEPGSFSKYQFLHIGNYYITEQHREHYLHNVKESNCVNGHKILITSSTRLWSISFTFDDDLLHRVVSHPTQLDDFSLGDNAMISGDQIDLHHESCSDIYLHLPTNAKNLLVFKYKEQEEWFIKPEDIGNMSPCYRNVTSLALRVRVLLGSDHLFPEGNLSSIQGQVVTVHNGHSCIDSDLNCQHSNDGSLSRFFLGVKSSSCIHILVDDQIVKIFGSLNNRTLPVGFGPGVNATFHRVLELGDQRRLMLTPLSFINVDSFRVYNHSFTEKYPDCTPYLDSIPLQLFSELIHSACYKSTMFRCRVVAVSILVLAKNTDSANLQSDISYRQPLVSIPLAGFILDDGSSRCNCWTSGKKAAALLRLHDPLPSSAFENFDWTLKWTTMAGNFYATASYHLDRVVKKHGRVTVRSFGSMLDSYQDVDISLSSEGALSSADEDLLKFVSVNACSGATWTVIGSQLDSDAVQSLLKGHIMEPELLQSQNIWVTDVYCTNTLHEAKNAILELMNM